MSKSEDIDDVRGDGGPPLSGGIRELSSVIELGIAHLVGADGVDALSLQGSKTT